MENLDLLTEKIFDHFKDNKNRSYPLLLEKEEIKEELEKLNNNSDSFYLLDKLDDEIQGLCGYYIIEKDKYIQTTIFFSLNQNMSFIHKILHYLIKKYPDYNINIGVEADNSLLVDELNNAGFVIIDDLYPATIELNTTDNKEYSEIEEVNLTHWEDFKEIHEKHFGAGYWNFHRIKDDFSNWKIYCIKNNLEISAYLFIRSNLNSDTCEIFGIYGDDIGDRIRLIEYSIATIKDKRLMYYFIEDYAEMDACKKIGFVIHGHYQGWVHKI